MKILGKEVGIVLYCPWKKEGEGERERERRVKALSPPFLFLIFICRIRPEHCRKLP